MSGSHPNFRHAPSARVLCLPLAFIAAFAAFLLVPRIQSNLVLVLSFTATSVALTVWLIVLWGRANARSLRVDVSIRPQHYLQALAHTAIFVYWGIYWQPIQDAAALIAAQIVFAYAFDMLLAWSRRDDYTLGFGPFPIIYSTNLFLRFHDDWFYLQFLMVAVGFLAKDMIRWERDGRRVHIFNPSSFPLALFSVALIVTGTTEITWGEDIAALLSLPPQIYLFIFLVALPGQFLFSVTTMTLPAVLTTYLFSVVYLRVTGTYLFFDANIPIAVFLGMHLLFTDPSTSPRTELGRIAFGVLYGLSVVGLFIVLEAAGVPTFYDKLLQVPLLNLMVKAIDRAARSARVTWLDPARLGATLSARKRSLVYVSLWIVVFGTMTAANGVGDHHPGFSVRFWEAACLGGRPNACRNLAVLESQACRDGSGWSCNSLGILVATGRVEAAPAKDLFSLACSLGTRAGCENQKSLGAGAGGFSRRDPQMRDYLLLLTEGRALDVEQTPLQIYTHACEEGWPSGCGDLARFYLQGDGVPPNKALAAELLATACAGGHAASCSNLGLMYKLGDGVSQNGPRALDFLKKACELGSRTACAQLAQETR